MDIIPGADGDNNAAEPGDRPQESSEEDDPEQQPATSYPQRERRRPKMLTYKALGEPMVVEVGVESLQVSLQPAEDCGDHG